MQTVNTTKRDSTRVWFIPPARDWRRKSQGAFASAGLLVPLSVLVSVIFVLFVSIFLTPYVGSYIHFLQAGQTVALIAAVIALFVVVARIQSNLLEPLTHMRFWAMRMRGGHLLARIPQPTYGEFADLARDINSLGESLCTLTRDMEEQVRVQTELATQKSRSLFVLYEVATNINSSRNLNEVISRFLETMRSLMNAKAASVRLLTDDDQLRLVSSIGLDKNAIDKERFIPITNCLCGDATRENKVRCQPLSMCEKVIAYPIFNQPDTKLIAVPLTYRGRVLGVYNLFVDKNEFVENTELTGLLTSIGQHLGIAVAKADLENEAKRLVLMEERSLISQELHDSLAQTLASLRIQVRIIEQTLKSSDIVQAQRELQHLQHTLEKANSDLRELLSHFRTRMDERGLVPALNDSVRDFENQTGIAVYFQDETRCIPLPPQYEVQVLHIVQEALSNVRKHSRASNVRVLMRANPDGEWYILIEDDGEGMRIVPDASRAGEHFGIAIMRERAQYLGGALSIESEVDEGTRIELSFRLKNESEKDDHDAPMIYTQSPHKNTTKPEFEYETVNE